MVFRQITWTFSSLIVIGTPCWVLSSAKAHHEQVHPSEEACAPRGCMKAIVEDATEAVSTLSLLQVASKSNGTGQNAQQSVSNTSAEKTLLSSDLATDESLGFIWVMLSPLAACEYNPEGILPQVAEGKLTLPQCKTKCMRRPSCEAIDFYSHSGWCNIYDKSCSGPTTLKDGASSYRLNRTLSLSQFGATVQQVPQHPPPHDTKTWTTISWTNSCEENTQGIPDMFSMGGFTFARCKEKCEQTETCVAIDFYAQTGWCILYDTACTTPLKMKDGSSSHRLVAVAKQRPPAMLIEKVQFPTPSSSVRDVEKFMTSFGSPWAAAQMQDDQIDGEAFLLLSAADLKNYGVKRGPALKLSKRIKNNAVTAGTDEEVKKNALHEVVGPDGVLVISADSQANRFAVTRRKLRQAGINATRFVAEDLATASSQELEHGCPREGDAGVRDSCLRVNKTGYGCTSKYEQAMAASHLNALLAAKKRNWDWTAILEDDAVPVVDSNWSSIFRSAWKKMPPTAQMVRLGWCQIDVLNYADPVIHEVHANTSGAILTQRIGYGKFSSKAFHYEPGGCTTAYLVHKEILEDLISLFPCCGAVDACYKWDYFKKVNPKTGIERGEEVMMSVDSHRHPSVDGVIEYHGLIRQDTGFVSPLIS